MNSQQKKWLAKAQRALAAGGQAAQVMFHARDGGLLGTVLGVAGLAGIALEQALDSNADSMDVLVDEGFDTRIDGNGAADELFCRMLRDRYPTDRVKLREEYVLLWRDDKGLFAGAAYDDAGQLNDGPVFASLEGVPRFAAAVQHVAWEQGKHLSLVMAKKQTGKGRRSYEAAIMHLVPVPDPGPFIVAKGEPDVAWYGERIKRYGKGPRAFRIRGPSGVGKSVLAQHVAEYVAGKDARVLKIPAATTIGTSPSEFVHVVAMLQPTVLLIDDIDVRNDVAAWLAMLEALRDPNCLTIATEMTDDTDDGPGDWYLPGMRPGRVDETFSLKLPSAPSRYAILLHYRAKAEIGTDFEDCIDADTLVHMATEAAGLSGAYLAELIRRVHAHGEASWREELRDIRRSAPVARGPVDAVAGDNGSAVTVKEA